MKRAGIIFMHLGYWTLYCLLLLFMYGMMRTITFTDDHTEGLGLAFKRKQNKLVVDYVFKTSPAEKAGIQVGDLVSEICIGDSAALDISKLKISEIGSRLNIRLGDKANFIVQKKNGKNEYITLVSSRIFLDLPSPLYHWLPLFAGCGVIPGIVAFYGFYLVLFPRFLGRRRIVAFCIGAILVGILAVIPGEIFLRFFFWKMPWRPDVYAGFGIILLINGLLNGAMGMVIRGFITWYKEIKLKEELNEKNQSMELALIRSQINPHFLFNTLNNIDGLILKDPPAASSYLVRLSDILRFMLYDTGTGKVPLEKELDYIRKYIDLQKIRTDNKDFIDLTLTGEPDSLEVEPMMFMPFIENAFKHTENKKIDKAIEISLRIEGRQIFFECRNRYQSGRQMHPEYGGLGNELIIRRLNLLYPHTHKLEIRDEDQVYSVTLALDL